MKAKLSSQKAALFMVRSGARGLAFQEILSRLFREYQITPGGKRQTPTSGISFRFGNRSGAYRLPHQGEREMARRRRQMANRRVHDHVRA